MLRGETARLEPRRDPFRLGSIPRSSVVPPPITAPRVAGKKERKEKKILLGGPTSDELTLRSARDGIRMTATNRHTRKRSKTRTAQGRKKERGVLNGQPHIRRSGWSPNIRRRSPKASE